MKSKRTLTLTVGQLVLMVVSVAGLTGSAGWLMIGKPMQTELSAIAVENKFYCAKQHSIPDPYRVGNDDKRGWVYCKQLRGF